MRPLCLLFCLSLSLWAGQRWRLKYFYDQNDSSLSIADLCFPSARRAIAAGSVSQNGKQRPTLVLSEDSGKTWQLKRAPAMPDSLFFLDENRGWLVGEDEIWHTSDGGQNWIRASKLKGALRVWFNDAEHGFAIGLAKTVCESADGGKTWTPLAAAAEPSTTKERTVYNWITFAGPHVGMITGWSRAPRKDGPDSDVPYWMDPQPDKRRKEWPTSGIMMQTLDGGKTWKSGVTSMFGHITRTRLAADGRGLGLIEFFDSFEWPSEVYQLDWHTGKSTRVFRRSDRAVTDILLFSQGPAYLAAIEPSGTMARSPIPGKLKMLQSRDLENWDEIPVDYRAVAGHAVLAAPDPAHPWVATDTGMLLALEEE